MKRERTLPYRSRSGNNQGIYNPRKAAGPTKINFSRENTPRVYVVVQESVDGTIFFTHTERMKTGLDVAVIPPGHIEKLKMH
jgi:hypothetical protein